MAKYRQAAEIVLRGRTENLKAAFGMANNSLTTLSSKLVRLRTMAISTFGAYTIARGLASLTGAALSFQKQMAEVHTMLRDGGERFLPAFSKQVRELSIEFGQGTETIAAGLYDILSAGIPVEGAMDVLKASLISATGGLTDLQTAAYGATSIINAYGLAADQATRVNDLLFAVVEQGKIRFNELSAEIGKVVSVARAAGISLEQVMALIATIVRVEDPARGITALRAAIMNVAGTGKPFLEIVKGLEGANLAMLKSAGFARRAGVGMAIVTSNIENLNDQLGIMENVAGKSLGAANKVMQTLYFSGEQLKQLFLDLKRVMGEEVAKAVIDLGMAFKGNREALEDYARTIGKTIGWVISLVKEHHQLIIGFLLFGSAIKVVAAGVAVFQGLSAALAMVITKKAADTAATLAQTTAVVAQTATTSYLITAKTGQLHITSAVTKAKVLENIQTKLGISLTLGNARAVRVFTAAKAGLIAMINPLTIALAGIVAAYLVYTKAINNVKKAQQEAIEWQEKWNVSIGMLEAATTLGGKAAGYEKIEKDFLKKIKEKKEELRILETTTTMDWTSFSIGDAKAKGEAKRKLVEDVVKELQLQFKINEQLKLQAQTQREIEKSKAAQLEKDRIAYKASELGLENKWLAKNEKLYGMERDMKIKYMKDVEQKELAALDVRYEKRREKAVAENESLEYLAEILAEEKANIREKHRKREFEIQKKEQAKLLMEHIKLWKKRSDMERDLYLEVIKLKIDANKTGYEKRLYYIALETEELKKAAAEVDLNLDKIIDARAAELRKIAAQNMADVGTRGVPFAERAMALRAPGFADPIKILQATQRTNVDHLIVTKDVRTILENIDNKMLTGKPIPAWNP